MSGLVQTLHACRHMPYHTAMIALLHHAAAACRSANWWPWSLLHSNRGEMPILADIVDAL